MPSIEMDGKDMTTSAIVNRALRKILAPVLREAGFMKIEARNAWLWQEKAIQVFHIHSVGYNFSEVTGWPPGSLHVEVGIFFTFMPKVAILKYDATQRPLPAEYHCHLRRTIECGIDQTKELANLSTPAEQERKDLWWVNPDGSNADYVASDIARAFVEDGMPWYAYFNDLCNTLAAVERSRDCPIKFELAAFLARELGDETRWQKYASLAGIEAELS